MCIIWLGCISFNFSMPAHHLKLSSWSYPRHKHFVVGVFHLYMHTQPGYSGYIFVLSFVKHFHFIITCKINRASIHILSNHYWNEKIHLCWNEKIHLWIALYPKYRCPGQHKNTCGLLDVTMAHRQLSEDRIQKQFFGCKNQEKILKVVWKNILLGQLGIESIEYFNLLCFWTSFLAGEGISAHFIV